MTLEWKAFRIEQNLALNPKALGSRKILALSPKGSGLAFFLFKPGPANNLGEPTQFKTDAFGDG